MKNFFNCVASLLFILTANARTYGEMIIQTASYNGGTYYLIGDDAGARTTWTDAEAFARTLGGHLVTVNDVDENTRSYLRSMCHDPAPIGPPVGSV